MKKLLGGFALLVGGVSSLSAHAQQPLAGTAWQGTINAPDPMEVVLQFKRDTLLVLEQANRQVIETMHYTQKGDQWTWYKLGGGSPCNQQMLGTYAYKIDKDELAIRLVQEGCEARAASLTGKPFKKITWPAR